MITSLYLEGFKSFGKPVTIDFRDITLLYGENSSGKSTILQALQYAREVFCNGNLDCLKTEIGGDFGNLGGFKKFVYERDAARSVKIGIGVDYREKDFDFGRIGPLIKQSRKCIMHGSMHEYLNDECRDEDWRPRNESTELPFDEQIDKFQLMVTIAAFGKLQHVKVTKIELHLNDSQLVIFSAGENPDEFHITVNAGHHCLPDSIISDEEWRSRLLSVFGDDFVKWKVFFSGRLTDIVCFPIDNSRNWIDEFLLSEVNLSKAGYFDLGDVVEFDFPGFEIPTITENTAKDLMIPAFYSCAFLLSCANELRSLLSGLRYIGPLRRHYSIPELDSGKCAERPWADGVGAWDHLAETPAIVNDVNYWMTNDACFRFDCVVDSSLNLEKEIDNALNEMPSNDSTRLRQALSELILPTHAVLRLRSGLKINSTDIGVGYSQLLPIVVAAFAKSDGVIMLEQPELHIHVRLQAVLGDLIATSISEKLPGGSRQFIVETHSEALLLRLMRRIRETTKEIVNNGPRLLCDHVAVYHISKQDGNSIAKKIELDTYGNLTDHWPDDLFDISFKERFGE